MNPGAQYGSAFVEITGIAAADGSPSVREERSCDMGDSFNLANYEAVVQMANGKYRHLFSS